VGVIVKRKGPRGTTWRVRIRKGGHELSRSFHSAQAAKDWERDVEKAIDVATPRSPFRATDWLTRPVDFWDQHADPSQPTPIKGSTLSAAIRRYILAKGDTLPKDKANRLNAWCARKIAEQPFDAVSADDLQTYIEERIEAGIAANTVRNDVFTLSSVFTHANTPQKAKGRGGWGMHVINPCELVELPPPGPARERRFKKGEEARLRKGLASVPDGDQMLALLDVLLESGMRLGEALLIRPSWLFQGENGTHYIELPAAVTKNGLKRNVVISREAYQALLEVVNGRNEDSLLFSLNRAAIEYRWKLAVKAGKVVDFHIHDLRHEALSRMSEKGLTLEELQSQSGHQSVKILMRYLHASPDRIAAKLN
jgi:integrase